MPTMSAERGAARRALRLTKLEHKLFRSNILPIAFGFPFGLSIVVPVNMPLPTKIVTQVLQPIDIAAEFGDDPGVAEIDAHVRFVMHSAIDRLARKRGCLSSAGALASPKPPIRSARLSSRCNADADIARHRRPDRGASGLFHVGRSWTPGCSSSKIWAQRRHPWRMRRWSAKPEGAQPAAPVAMARCGNQHVGGGCCASSRSLP